MNPSTPSDRRKAFIPNQGADGMPVAEICARCKVRDNTGTRRNLVWRYVPP